MVGSHAALSWIVYRSCEAAPVTTSDRGSLERQGQDPLLESTGDDTTRSVPRPHRIHALKNEADRDACSPPPQRRRAHSPRRAGSDASGRAPRRRRAKLPRGPAHRRATNLK